MAGPIKRSAQFPSMRQWVGPITKERGHIKNLVANGFTILNRKFEPTLEILRDDIADDRLGVFKPMFSEMGQAARMILRICTGEMRLNAGFGLWKLAYGSLQTLNAANYAAARAQMMNLHLAALASKAQHHAARTKPDATDYRGAWPRCICPFPDATPDAVLAAIMDLKSTLAKIMGKDDVTGANMAKLASGVVVPDPAGYVPIAPVFGTGGRPC